MTVPLLADLRAPPVVGRFYMVPVVRWPYLDFPSDWPVLGALHEDAEFFSFKDLHYHIDGRFLDARQRQVVTRWARVYAVDGPALEVTVGAFPLGPRRFEPELVPKGRPSLARRRCSRSSYGYRYSFTSGAIAVGKAYGDPAEPRRLADGRLLCPHRKVDLSSFPPDAEGVVVCPLHGLRVRCAVPA